jgi:signal transduction histidine kinase
MLHRDGSFRRFSWTAVLDEVFVHAVGRDVTSEVEAAEALRKAEEALHHSQKMEAVGQLTGGIAHDFNNLLTGVIGSLDLIQTGAARGRTDRLDHYLNTALGSAKRAAALTHRLLAFSRRQPLARKSVEIGELVRSMSDLLRRTVREAIRIESSLEDGAFHTLCDPNQLENALLNLVINARDAIADDGTIRIHARTVMPDDPLLLAVPDLAEGSYVALSVTDSGAGMPSDVLAKAFEPFFTTKPIGHGTGLGLSMVYGFARQSGGSVLIQSEVDAGTTVTLFLPSHPLAEAPADPKPPEPLAAHTPAGARTILVVEDEPTVRSLVVDMLKDAGFDVLEAGDGHEGLQQVHSEARIDLLLTDVGLPKLNGRQLAEAARDHRPGIRILLMTGYLGKALPADLPIGSDMDIIPKPFTREALIARLAAVLSEDS